MVRLQGLNKNYNSLVIVSCMLITMLIPLVKILMVSIEKLNFASFCAMVCIDLNEMKLLNQHDKQLF